MATLTVLKFDAPDGAQKALDLIKGLQKQQLIQIHDAAIVSWKKGDKKPKTKQLTNLAGAGALNGAFWGMLFGLIFFVPFFGLAIGAAMGALAGKFSDYGIDDKFIDSVRGKGTSALFLLTSGAVRDKVREAAKGLKFELIASNLTKAEEKELMDAFGQG